MSNSEVQTQVNGVEIDMNSLFNFNYNFDILKFVLQSLLKSQKTLEEQINILINDNVDKGKYISSIEKELIETKLFMEKEPTKIKLLLERREKVKNKKFKPIIQINENLSPLNINPKNIISPSASQNKSKESSNNTNNSNFSKQDFLNQTFNINNSNQEIKNIKEKMNLFEKEIEDIKNNINISINNSTQKVEDKLYEKINESIDNFKIENMKEREEKNEKINNQIKEISESFPLTINQKIKPINENIDNVKTDIINLENDLNAKNSQLERSVQELKNKISNIVNKIKDINEKFNYYSSLSELEKTKEEMKQNLENEITNIKIENSVQKKSLEKLKIQVLEFLNDQTDHDEIQNLRKKFESIMSTIYLLQDFTKEYYQKEKEKPIFDPSKFLNINQFNDYKIGIIKQLDKTKNLFEETKNQISEINDKELKNKISFRELKELEDSLLIKLEDLKIIFSQKYIDKKEMNKNMKNIEQQIKQIIEMNKKNEKNENNWLLSKKPYGHLCASCESYLGDLKENIQYIPWNKYPIKDPNDKLYRIGAGFSKMLSIVSVDNNNKDNLNHSYSTNNINFNKNKNIKDFNANININISDYNNSIQEEQDKGLPKIPNFKKKFEDGKDEIVNSPFEEKIIKEEEENEKPKM